jgi:hypothetical protein
MNNDFPRGSTFGVTAVGIFLFFGAVMASLAGGTLIWRGSTLDKVWSLNPEAYNHLVGLGKPVGILFLILSAALAIAGVGWFKRRLWGWRLAVGIILTQILGDMVNSLRGDFMRGGIGLVLSSALLFYILRSEVKAVFEPTRSPTLRVPDR